MAARPASTPAITTGVTSPHHTIARCAAIARMKNSASVSSGIHGTGRVRRAKYPATSSPDTIMNQPEACASVTGAHSLIVLRITGFVERS